MNPQKPSSQLLNIPRAIIVAGAIIAIAIIFTLKPAKTNVTNQPTPVNSKEAAVNLPPITGADHIFGNPDAKVKIVEYSDPSCPYCKMFDPTMQQIISEYGPSGNVAWVYRSFPLDKPGTRPNNGILHPNAGREAQAMECAGTVGGNQAFWLYEKKWYEVFPQDGASRTTEEDNKQLLEIAQGINLIDANSFNDCLTSGKTKDLVEKQYESGIKAGITGTPSSFIITPSGNKIPLEGAQSYETLKSVIDSLISGNNNQ